MSVFLKIPVFWGVEMLKFCVVGGFLSGVFKLE